MKYHMGHECMYFILLYLCCPVYVQTFQQTYFTFEKPYFVSRNNYKPEKWKAVHHIRLEGHWITQQFLGL